MTETVHDGAMRCDALDGKHAFKLIFGIKSLQHGKAGRGPNVVLVRRLAARA